MNIIFFGSSEYCLPILEALKTHFTLVGVVTKKGQSVVKYALSHNIKVFIPKNKPDLLSLKDELIQLKPDLAVVADYGLIIPKEIFDIPLYKTLNVHFSKLPQLRGPSPVQNTILTGGKNAGISVIIMDEDLDTGDIIWQKDAELTGDETTGSLYTKLFNIIAFDLPDIINKYVQNDLKPQKQDHQKAAYTIHLKREDGFIPFEILKTAMKGIKTTREQLQQWKLIDILLPKTDTNISDRLHSYHSAILIDRTIRAFTPWPGLWTTIQITDNKQQITKRLKILKAHLEPTTKLVLDLVQLEGKKPVSWKQFVDGYPDFFF